MVVRRLKVGRTPRKVRRHNGRQLHFYLKIKIKTCRLLAAPSFYMWIDNLASQVPNMLMVLYSERRPL